MARGPSAVHKIAVMMTGDRPLTADEIREVMAPLRALGWIEGRNLVVERRYFWTPETVRRVIEGLVADKVEVIVTTGPGPTRAAMEVTKTIPIVFFVADPIAMGVATDLAHPTGNVTGVSAAEYERHAKLLSIVKEVIPDLRRVGILEVATNPAYLASRPRMESLARSLGLEPVIAELAGADDIEGVMASLARRRAQALILRADAFTGLHGAELITAALRRNLATMSTFADFARKEGALVSYGINDEEVKRRLNYYVDRILRGAKPSELPIEQPTEFRLILNLKTADALGVAVPQSVVLQAAELIR